MRLLPIHAAVLAMMSRFPRAPVRMQLSDSSWFFSSVRGGDEDACEITLPAVTVPMAAPLWVGEIREIRLRSVLKAAQPLLASLRGDETFLFVTASTRDSLAGSVVTEAKLSRAEWMDGTSLLERVEVVGVARYRISAVAGERPFFLLRGLRLFDEVNPSSGGVAQRAMELSAAMASAEEAWAVAHPEGDISLSDELERTGRILGLPERRGGSAEARADLAASYRELIDGAIARHGLGSGDGSPVWADEIDAATAESHAQAYESTLPVEQRAPTGDAAHAYDAERMAMLSHVALRLASGGDEGERRWAEMSVGGMERWERANGLLMATRDRLGVGSAVMTAAATTSADNQGETE